MSKKNKEKWNPPSWPWEMELITLIFFLIALLIPVYFNAESGSPTAEEIRQVADMSALSLSSGHDMLNMQFGFLWAVAIVALYIMHLTFSFLELERVTASPLHLLSPCAFAVLAYNRIDNIPNLQNTALSSVDGSISQILVLVAVVGLLTSILARLRKYRYLLDFDDVQWDVTSRSVYDASYLGLMMLIRPLLYAPRQFRACSEGILIEGWFYAAPIAFNDVRAIATLNSASTNSTGYYYASSAKNLVRMELHDSLKPTFISPKDREDFVRYCVQHIAHRRPSRKANSTRHDMLHAADTRAGGTTHAGGTRAGTHAGNSRAGGTSSSSTKHS